VVSGWRATLEQVWLDGLLERGYPLQRQVDVAEKAVAALEPLGAGRALSRAWRLSGDSLFCLGRCQAGVAAYQKAVDVAVASGDHGQEMLALQQLMVALVPGPMPAKAAIELCKDLLGRDPDNLLLQASAQTSVGVHLAMQNRFDEGRAELARSRHILTDLDLPLYLANDAFFFTGYVEMLAGEYAAAEPLLRYWCDFLEVAGEHTVRSSGLVVLAQALLALGDLDEAERLSRESQQIAGADDLAVQVQSRYVLASVLRRRGDLTQAEDAARRAVELVTQSDWLNLRGESLEVLADVLAASGRHGEAMTAAREAVGAYTAKGNLVALGPAQQRVDRLERPRPVVPSRG
jgi:tetratricopeptide (TPR) repeat protein